VTAAKSPQRSAFSLDDPWLTVEQVAEVLSVDKSYVYRHRLELGGVKVGAGPKAPVRFPPAALAEATSCLTGRESQEAGSGTAAPIQRPRQRAQAEPVPEWEPLRVVGRG
jgi:hypothetical protein